MTYSHSQTTKDGRTQCILNNNEVTKSEINEVWLYGTYIYILTTFACRFYTKVLWFIMHLKGVTIQKGALGEHKMTKF